MIGCRRQSKYRVVNVVKQQNLKVERSRKSPSGDPLFCKSCNPAPPRPQLVPISVQVKLFQDSKVKALSDHNGVAAELEWQCIDE